MALAALFLQGCGGADTGAGAGPSVSLASTTVSMSEAYPVTGWASQGEGTTGGAGAPASNIYLVRNWAQLKASLANRNSPTYATNPAAAKLEPKIIQIAGTIYGTDIGNGRLADEAYYKSLNATAAKWDWNLYLQSLDTAFMADLNARAAQGDPVAIATKSKLSALSSAKSTLRNIQKEQIQAIIPSNTTIVGVGIDAMLIDGYFSINASRNIIVRTLEL
jgi:pectate lyase